MHERPRRLAPTIYSKELLESHEEENVDRHDEDVEDWLLAFRTIVDETSPSKKKRRVLKNDSSGYPFTQPLNSHMLFFFLFHYGEFNKKQPHLQGDTLS